jgi:hypothetical protein
LTAVGVEVGEGLGVCAGAVVAAVGTAALVGLPGRFKKKTKPPIRTSPPKTPPIKAIGKGFFSRGAFGGLSSVETSRNRVSCGLGSGFSGSGSSGGSGKEMSSPWTEASMGFISRQASKFKPHLEQVSALSGCWESHSGHFMRRLYSVKQFPVDL